jgi:transposase
MPKSYSADLRKRVIEAVASGTSRHEVAELFGIAVSTAVKWWQCWRDTGSAVPKPRGGSTSRLEEHMTLILGLVKEQPDSTFKELLAALRKRRIRSSRTALWRFFERHNITFKKKACRQPNGSGRTWLGHAGAGSESKACLIPPAWSLSTRRQSVPT